MALMFFDLTLPKKRVEVLHIKYDDLDTSINISCINRNNEIACQYMKQAQRTRKKRIVVKDVSANYKVQQLTC